MNNAADTDLNNNTLDTCGCCEDLPTLARSVSNRPGLPMIRYRLGRYGTFMEQLIARLTQEVSVDPETEEGPTLTALKTRQADDGAIALLDAWAIVADVLTFYQERIANENYLRTATERRSVLELARAIGYELNPGVAASTYLAFTVAATPGAPERVEIPQGLQVLSIPGQGELPQTFETAQAFTAYPEWNTLQPRLTQPQDLAFAASTLYLWTADPDLSEDLAESDLVAAETTTESDQINVSDLSFLGAAPEASLTQVTAIPIQQIYLKGISQNVKVGQRLLFVGTSAGENKTTKTLVKVVLHVEKQPENNLTRVDFALDIKPKTETRSRRRRHLARRLRAKRAQTVRVNAQAITALAQTAISEQILQASLQFNRLRPQSFVAEAASPPPPEEDITTGIFVLKQQVNCFGHNAPLHATLPAPKELRGSTNNDPYKESWDDDDGTTIWQNSQSVSYTELGTFDLYLERSLPELTPESWIVMETTSGQPKVAQIAKTGGIGEVSLVDYGLSGKSTGLKLKSNASSSKPPRFRVRKTAVYAQSERLSLAPLPVVTPLAETTEETADTTPSSETTLGVSSLELDTIVLGLQTDQPVLIKGNLVDSPAVTAAEVAILEAVVHEGSNTTLYFQTRLQHGYGREGMAIYANVVLATHGETHAEVLGSGDRTQSHQTFKLKKSPLTYTSASTPSGAASSFSVRVNNILWQETAALYGLSSEAERYIVRIEDDGTTNVIFGDAQQGSRLPTGLENVTAVYRSGIGPEGEVPASSLSLLKQRPLGVEQVTNPLAATGAEAPEQLANARRNAPLTVLTLDRIVSRQDYEDFAVAFAGIGKAQAVSIWDGFSEQVHVTIAAASGEPVPSDSEIYKNLVAAINSYRDPGAPFVLDSFVPRSFNVTAKLRLDSRYIAEQVLAQVKQGLLKAFAFEKRAFGQGVSAAEVIALMQSVAGVVAVDLDGLYASDDDVFIVGRGFRSRVRVTPDAYLPAAIARWSPPSNSITQADLLLINPVGISLEENPS